MMATADMFWPRVLKTNTCCPWIGATTLDGYGVLSVGGKLIYAHRLAWCVQRGRIPFRRLVCHRCDQPSCVRADHRFVGTPADNGRDASSKGRCALQRYPWLCDGERNPFAKLTERRGLR